MEKLFDLIILNYSLSLILDQVLIFDRVLVLERECFLCLTWVVHPVQFDRQLWGHRYLLSRQRPADIQTQRCHLQETCRTCTRSWTERQRHSEVGQS